MFSYTGLTLPEVNFLREKYHIYIHSSGRISIAGRTHTNTALFHLITC